MQTATKTITDADLTRWNSALSREWKHMGFALQSSRRADSICLDLAQCAYPDLRGAIEGRAVRVDCQPGYLPRIVRV